VRKIHKYKVLNFKRKTKRFLSLIQAQDKQSTNFDKKRDKKSNTQKKEN